MDNQLAPDHHGFLLSGSDATRPRIGSDTTDTGTWSAPHIRPLLVETSLPGIFAIGDVRYGFVKRVASAVGKGAMAIHMVHERLANRDRA